MNKNKCYFPTKSLVHQLTNKKEHITCLTEERDACGVGFIANINEEASHKIVMKGIEALTCMEHRGGCGADKDSGDGSGLTTGIPTKLFLQYYKEQKWIIEPTDSIGIGMTFLPSQYLEKIKSVIEQIVIREQFKFLGWRKVPTNPDVLGIQAKLNKPEIFQFFIQASNIKDDKFEQNLYLIRKKIEQLISQLFIEASKNFYICSLSCRTIVYKGMVRSSVLGQFYQDLYHPHYESAFAIYHRRFSTNTMPKWPLAQPMRFIAHNGEINTFLGNLNWMKTREPFLEHPEWNETIKELLPITNSANSDSANLDAIVELLINTGRSPEETLMIVIPEAYENQPELKPYPEVTQFYEYYSHLVEAWDGPALVTFTDGKTIGATLDRNGLRPARYCITHDNTIIVSSESGAINIRAENVSKKGRLGPGQMILTDFQENLILENWSIKSRVAKQLPYGDILKVSRNILQETRFLNEATMSDEKLFIWQTAFGYTIEDVELVIENMASQGKEPTFCMGDDIPLAVLDKINNKN